MSNKFEFISYTPTPQEEKSSGVVAIKVNVPTVLYFQFKKKKDGSGSFWSSPAVKVPGEEGDRYRSCMPDSNTDAEEILTFVRAQMKAHHGSIQDAPIDKTQSLMYPYPAKHREQEEEPEQGNLPF